MHLGWGAFRFWFSHHSIFTQQSWMKSSAKEILTQSCTSVLGFVISHLLSISVSYKRGQPELYGENMSGIVQGMAENRHVCRTWGRNYFKQQA